ncbi:MAG: hypothetical protein ACYCUG_12805 [Acidimicrobiales bacterium]
MARPFYQGGAVPARRVAGNHDARVFTALVALHVICALVGFGSVAFSGVYGFAAGRSPLGEETTRYFSRPSRAEWLLLAVPFLGLAALAAEPHGHGVAQLWAGLAAGVWLAAAGTLLGVVRPAERAIRDSQAAGDAAGVGRTAARLGWAGVGTDIAFAVALGLMIWQPR